MGNIDGDEQKRNKSSTKIEDRGARKFMGGGAHAINALAETIDAFTGGRSLVRIERTGGRSANADVWIHEEG